MTLTRFRVLVMQSKKENPTATFEDLLDTLMRKPLNSGYSKETKGNRRGNREKKKKGNVVKILSSLLTVPLTHFCPTLCRSSQ